MCSEEKIRLARADKAYVFRKKSFYITTSITLLIVFASLIASFMAVKLQANVNAENITKNCENIQKIETQTKGIEEIKFNIKNICNALKIEYIKIGE